MTTFFLVSSRNDNLRTQKMAKTINKHHGLVKTNMEKNSDGKIMTRKERQ